MQAQFIFNSGVTGIANVDKLHIIKDSHGHLIGIQWTTPDDAYAELKYLDARQVVAVVMIHDTPGQTPLSAK